MSVLKAFNNHFIDFLEDVHRVFPEDRDIKKAKTALEMLRKANPRLIIQIWRAHIADKYASEIAGGDLEFFLSKDYSADVTGADNAGEIMGAVDRLRGPIRNMGEDNQQKAMKYIQNLTKLSQMYA